MQDSTCRHCGWPIVRAKAGDAWKHYSTLKEECQPPPVAEPMLDAHSRVVPLTTKTQGAEEGTQ
jgi:hypothetical protein